MHAANEEPFTWSSTSAHHDGWFDGVRVVFAGICGIAVFIGDDGNVNAQENVRTVTASLLTMQSITALKNKTEEEQ